jgi:cobalt/nickel transport system permease protein
MHISDGILAPSVLAGGYVAAGGLAALGLRRIEDRRYPLIGILTASFFVASLVRVPVPPTSVHLTLAPLLGVVLGIHTFPAIMIALFLQAVLLGHGGISALGVNTLIMGVPGYLAGQWLRYGLRKGYSGWVPYVGVISLTCVLAARIASELAVRFGWTATPLPWTYAVVLGLLVAAIACALTRVARVGPLFRCGFAAGGMGVLVSAAALFAVLSWAPLDRHASRDGFEALARFAFLAHSPVVLVEGTIVGLLIRYLAAVQPSLLLGPDSPALAPQGA